MTRGILVNPAVPPEPDKKLVAWKNPINAYRLRDPRCRLWLHADISRPFDLQELRPWEIIRALVDLHGEHIVTLDVSGLAPPKQSAERWRRSRWSWKMEVPSAWLAQQQSWADHAEVLGKDPQITARRGGGSSSHLAWWLHWAWHDIGRRGECKLELATRSITYEQLEELNVLIDLFFTSSNRIGALYGRGLIERTDPRRTLGGELDTLTHSLWHDCRQRDRDVVPDVYELNLLGPSMLKRMGGLEALPLTWPEKNAIKVTPLEGGAALVRTHRLSVDDFNTETWKYEEDIAERSWLLYLFAKAGLTIEQNLQWYPEYVAATEKQAKEAPPSPADQQRQLREQRAAARALFVDLRSCPPSCINLTPKPVLDDKALRRLGHNEEWVTAFDLRGDRNTDAFTLYGRPTADKLQLGSPVRAGSLDPDRAALNFDAYLHGWDGAQVEPGSRTDTRKLKQFKCPKCQGRHFRLRAFFEYADDTASSLDDKDLPRAEDFFTWFSLDARCVACSWKGTVADIETA